VWITKGILLVKDKIIKDISKGHFLTHKGHFYFIKDSNDNLKCPL